MRRHQREGLLGCVQITDVGVKAIDDYTLEIKLEYPMPYLPGVLKHYTAFPLPQHVVEKPEQREADAGKQHRGAVRVGKDTFADAEHRDD